MRLVIWCLLFLAVAGIVWRETVFQIFDDIFETEFTPVIDQHFSEPIAPRAEPPSGKHLIPAEYDEEMIRGSSETARTDLLHHTVRQPSRHSATDNSVTQDRYADQYLVPSGEPEIIRYQMTDGGMALHKKEIPSLNSFQESRTKTPEFPSESDAEFPPILDRSKLDAVAPMISLSGGSFRMGSDLAEEWEQRPQHLVRLTPFRLDRNEVTNRQFQMFVRETKYQTSAERCGWSYVFDSKRKMWVRMVGASWWNPSGNNPHAGPESVTVSAMSNYPVVHVSWDDAQAFCRWSGKRLPSEAEWEYAAKGGLIDADYPWGKQRLVNGVVPANVRQGLFLDENTAAVLMPAGSFPANRYGLNDMGGNAYEWCGDRYRSDYYRRNPLDNPLGPAPEEGEVVTVPLYRLRKDNGRYVEEEFDGMKEVALRVIRGGSFLSAENNDAGYRTTARNHQPQSFSFQDVGFRCAE